MACPNIPGILSFGVVLVRRYGALSEGPGSGSSTSINGSGPGFDSSSPVTLPEIGEVNCGNGGNAGIDALIDPRTCVLPRKYESVLCAVPKLATVVYDGARARSAPSFTLLRTTSNASSYSPSGNCDSTTCHEHIARLQITTDP